MLLPVVELGEASQLHEVTIRSSGNAAIIYWEGYVEEVSRTAPPHPVYLWNFRLARVPGGLEEKLRFARGPDGARGSYLFCRQLTETAYSQLICLKNFD